MGISTLLVVSFISDAIAEFGFDYIFSVVVKELYKRGETKETMIAKNREIPCIEVIEIEAFRAN